MLKLIIFDLDGTLVDSCTDLTNALNHAIRPFGFEPLTVQKTSMLIGEGITKLVEKMLGPDRMQLHDEVLGRFLEYYSAHLTDFTKPYQGVAETLDMLGEYRKAVLSNKRELLSKKVLTDLGLIRHFDMVCGSDSTDEKKPSPKPLRKIIEALSCEPAATVMVGDSTYDIDAGKAAGVRTVAVAYGYRQKDELQAADVLIDSISDLPRVLKIIDGYDHNA